MNYSVDDHLMRTDQFYQIINVNSEHCVRSSKDEFPAEYVLSRDTNMHLNGNWQVCVQSFDLCVLHIDLADQCYIDIERIDDRGRVTSLKFEYKHICGRNQNDIIDCLTACHQNRADPSAAKLHAFFARDSVVPISWTYDSARHKCSVTFVVDPAAHANVASMHLTMSVELAEMLGFSDAQRTIEARGLRGQAARADGRKNEAPTVADNFAYIHKNLDNLYVLLPGVVTPSTLINNTQVPCVIRIPGLKAPDQTQTIANAVHQNQHRTHYCPDEKMLFFDCEPNMIWQYKIKILLNNGKLARFCKDPGYVTLSLIFKRKAMC
jgi:hypothetical protein